VRVLDIDLDFFVDKVAYWRPAGSERLDGDEFTPWRLEDAMNFLEHHRGLMAKLPGFVVEHHGELFDRWRDAIQSGVQRPPLAVTHVDAHADLGLGAAGYIYLLATLLHRPLKERRYPQKGEEGLGDGNYLAFAIANRWLDELTYVFNTQGDRPADLMIPVWRTSTGTPTTSSSNLALARRSIAVYAKRCRRRRRPRSLVARLLRPVEGVPRSDAVRHRLPRPVAGLHAARGRRTLRRDT
jgi:hypothetical protein